SSRWNIRTFDQSICLSCTKASIVSNWLDPVAKMMLATPFLAIASLMCWLANAAAALPSSGLASLTCISTVIYFKLLLVVYYFGASSALEVYVMYLIVFPAPHGEVRHLYRRRTVGYGPLTQGADHAPCSCIVDIHIHRQTVA